jgi:site-specific DNA-methyltransferase (adenine-specific)
MKELELNTIYNIDCLEFMKTLPDKCIDLVLTDPPYGLGIDNQKKSISNNPKHNRKEHIQMSEWDSHIPSKEYFDEIFRISKNQIIFGGNYFVEYLTEGHKGWILWDKGQHGLTMSDGELAYTSFDKPLRVFTFNRVELQKDGAWHPTMKPLELMKWIVKEYSNENETIFDPFCGSGSSLIACKLLKRNYIGCEISKEYCKIAEDRIKSISNTLF